MRFADARNFLEIIPAVNLTRVFSKLLPGCCRWPTSLNPPGWAFGKPLSGR